MTEESAFEYPGRDANRRRVREGRPNVIFWPVPCAPQGPAYSSRFAHSELDLAALADVMKALDCYFSVADAFLDSLRGVGP